MASAGESGDLQAAMRQARDQLNTLPRKATAVEMRFSDYKPLGGVLVPTAMVVDTAGQMIEEWTMTSVRVK
jgi:hypothetical protein